VFGRNQEPGSLHHLLARVPSALRIVTTNYDTLIEQAFREAGREFHLIMSRLDTENRQRPVFWWPPGSTEPNIGELDRLPEDLPVIYKLHGGFDPTCKWRRCVISEDDYFEVGGRVYESSFLSYADGSLLDDRQLLFLGYSLRDVHVRHLLGRFGRRELRSYLVSKSVSLLDRYRLA
jgi:hypothetical protein